MPYALGIDLGSGHLTAALSRNDRERWSEPETVVLDGSPAPEAVLHLTDDGTVEVGSRALRHVPARSDRIARGFVERVGDEVPIVLGGRPYPAEVLIAALVGWIVDHAEATEGAPASHLVVAHPADWGTHRRATLLGALREVSLPELTLLPRPVAAAESYAASERVEVGQEIAVHSLGAGRFESAVLRRGSFGFELRAHADSAEPLGGDLFDDLLATRVLAELDMEVDPAGLAKLRVACRAAKERLSTELAVTVPAPARSARGTVMVNRTDLEELVRPAVEATVTSLRRTIQAAGTSTGSLRAVVLVGGCGRIPLVSELVSAGVRVRVAAAADPEMSVARGAALAAARVAKPTVQAPALAHQPVARSAVTHTDLMRFDDLAEEEVADVGPPPPRPPVEIEPLEPPRRRLLRLGTRTGATTDDDLDELEANPSRSRALDLRPRRRTPDPRRNLDSDDDAPFDPDPDHDVRPRRRTPDPDPVDPEPAYDHDVRPSAYDDPVEPEPASGSGPRRAHDTEPEPLRRRDPGFPNAFDPDHDADARSRYTRNDGDPRRAHHPEPPLEPGSDPAFHREPGTEHHDVRPHRSRPGTGARRAHNPEPSPDPGHRAHEPEPAPPRRGRNTDPLPEPGAPAHRGHEPGQDNAHIRHAYEPEQGDHDVLPRRGRDIDRDQDAEPEPRRRRDPGAEPVARRRRYLDDDREPRPRTDNVAAEPRPGRRRDRDAGRRLRADAELVHHDPDAGRVPEPRHRGGHGADGEHDLTSTRHNRDPEPRHRYADDAWPRHHRRDDTRPQPRHDDDPWPQPRRRDDARSQLQRDDEWPQRHRLDDDRPSRHHLDEPEPGRHTDDSAFNESLSRHARTDEPSRANRRRRTDEPSRGRDNR